MVQGHDDLSGQLAVVDLDGTLIAGSSLKVCALSALAYRLRSRRLREAAGILWALSMYALKIYSHRRMKWAVLDRMPDDAEFRRRFTEKIHAMVRPQVKALLDDWRGRGCRILLATASPDVYVRWLWDGPFVATPYRNNPGRRECRGRDKLTAVNRYAAENGLKLYAVVTDHHDDLALLTQPVPVRILVSPSARTLAATGMAGIDITRTIG